MTSHAQHVWEQTYGQDFAPIGSSLNLQAILSSELGEYDLAEANFKRALALRERVLGPEHPEIASSLNGLANLYIELGMFMEAEPAIERAYAIWRKRLGAGHPRVITAMITLAQLRRVQGKYASAEELLQDALRSIEEAVEPSDFLLAHCLGSLGNVYLDQDRLADAEQAFVRTCDRYHTFSGSQHLPLARMMCNLAIVYHRQGRLEDARNLLVESLGHYEEVYGDQEPSLNFSDCLYSLASVDASLGDTEEAERLYNRILQSDTSGLVSARRTAMLAMQELARICASRGDRTAALEHFNDFFRTRRDFLHMTFSSSSEAQKIRWLRMYPMIDASLINLAVKDQSEQVGRLALEVVMNGKAVVTDAVIEEFREAFSSCDKTVQELLNTRATLCTRIANMVLAEQIMPTEFSFNETLERLQARKDTVESELSRLCSDFVAASDADYITVEEAAQALPEDALLCEFLVYNSFDINGADHYRDRPGEPRYARLTLDHSGTVTVRDLGPADAIDSLIVRTRRALYSAAAEVYSPYAAESESRLREITSRLTGILLDSVVSAKSSPRTLLVSPDGMLCLLPLEILPLPDGHYMVEKYRIAYLTCGRDLMGTGPSAPRSDDVLLMAAPDFDEFPQSPPGGSGTDEPGTLSLRTGKTPEYDRIVDACPGVAFSPMAASLDEVNRIASIVSAEKEMHVSVVTGAEANEQFLKNLTTVPRILHLATHGYFCSRGDTLASDRNNPLLRSGLALAGANMGPELATTAIDCTEDGNLTALEVSSLNLHGNKLTVLSTCESGVGEILEGEGVFGLRRAFRSAGSEVLVMSLWKVPNRATNELMCGFYSRWFAGESRVDALRESMLELMSVTQANQGHRHPLIWGGFVMVGRP